MAAAEEELFGLFNLPVTWSIAPFFYVAVKAFLNEQPNIFGKHLAQTCHLFSSFSEVLSRIMSA